jgi:hypothetical protein
MNQLQVIEHKQQRVLTTKQLAEFYDADPKAIARNFERNKNRYQEGTHYFALTGEELTQFKGSRQNEDSLKYVSVLYLWTERGCLNHAKSLGTDEAWAIYDELVETYFRAKEISKVFSQLSPQTQVLINLELKQKQLESEIAATKEQVTEIKETIINRNEDWRKDITKQLRKIGLKHGDFKKFVDESYKILEERAGCDLHRRLDNLKQRMALEGATKTSINKANYLDVISLDKRLREIYIGIVARMYVKYAA